MTTIPNIIITITQEPTKQQIISVARVFKHEPAKADMSEIFQPLKVRNRDTSGVAVDIWQHQHLANTAANISHGNSVKSFVRLTRKLIKLL